MMHRMARFTFLGLIVSLLFLLNACAHHASTDKSHPKSKEDPRNLSTTQLRLLAQEVLKNTPEYIHFANANFSWVVLAPGVQTNPQALQDEVMTLLKAKYKVYDDKKDLPDELLHKDKEGKLIGYKGGFSFSYSVDFEEKGIIKIQYGDYEGNLAASGHYKRYKWNGKNWDIVEKSSLVVS